jgi:hypothetical protein
MAAILRRFSPGAFGKKWSGNRKISGYWGEFRREEKSKKKPLPRGAFLHPPFIPD